MTVSSIQHVRQVYGYLRCQATFFVSHSLPMTTDAQVMRASCPAEVLGAPTSWKLGLCNTTYYSASVHLHCYMCLPCGEHGLFAGTSDSASVHGHITSLID